MERYYPHITCKYCRLSMVLKREISEGILHYECPKCENSHAIVTLRISGKGVQSVKYATSSEVSKVMLISLLTKSAIELLKEIFRKK